MKFALLFSIASLAYSASSATTPSARVCRARQPQVDLVRDNVRSPVYFCQFYLSYKRELSPLPNINFASLLKACVCILKDAGASVTQDGGSVPLSGRDIPCNGRYQSAVAREYDDPVRFCSFFNRRLRTRSPIRGLSVRNTFAGCRCLLRQAIRPISSSTKPSTTDEPEPETTSTLEPTTEQVSETTTSSISVVEATTTTTTTEPVTTSTSPLLPSPMTTLSTFETSTIATSSSTSTTTAGPSTTAFCSILAPASVTAFVQQSNDFDSGRWAAMYTGYGTIASLIVPITTYTYPSDARGVNELLTSCASSAVTIDKPSRGAQQQLELYFSTLPARAWYCIAYFENGGPHNEAAYTRPESGVECAFGYRQLLYRNRITTEVYN